MKKSDGYLILFLRELPFPMFTYDVTISRVGSLTLSSDTTYVKGNRLRRLFPYLLTDQHKFIIKQQLLDEIDQLKESRLCVICKQERSNRSLLPCGHLTTCKKCTEQIRCCPICRQIIKALVRVKQRSEE